MLDDARAFSASLGLTARGPARPAARDHRDGGHDRARLCLQLAAREHPGARADLLARRRGGGLFAATYRMQRADRRPAVSVNPLAALTPGFLRGLFGGSLGPPPQ